MSVVRDCFGLCLNPNTVSKFVRFFPKFAAAFFILHIIMVLYSSLASPKSNNVSNIHSAQALQPKDPSHRQYVLNGDLTRLEANKTKDIFKNRIKSERKVAGKDINGVR